MTVLSRDAEEDMKLLAEMAGTVRADCYVDFNVFIPYSS